MSWAGCGQFVGSIELVLWTSEVLWFMNDKLTCATSYLYMHNTKGSEKVELIRQSAVQNKLAPARPVLGGTRVLDGVVGEHWSFLLQQEAGRFITFLTHRLSIHHVKLNTQEITRSTPCATCDRRYDKSNEMCVSASV